QGAGQAKGVLRPAAEIVRTWRGGREGRLLVRGQLLHHMPCPVLGRVDRAGREARDDEGLRGAGGSLGGAPLAIVGFGHCSAPLLVQMPVVLYMPPRSNGSP